MHDLRADRAAVYGAEEEIGVVTDLPPIKKPASATAAIDKTLAALPLEQRAWLEKVRQTVQAACPAAEEAIVYGLPGLRYKGKGLAGYTAFKNHYGYYPMSGKLTTVFKDDLKSYKTAKGSIQFPLDKPVPVTLLKKLVKARIKEIDAPSTAKKTKK